jgi:hypothetical protein
MHCEACQLSTPDNESQLLFSIDTRTVQQRFCTNIELLAYTHEFVASEFTGLIIR